jgi:hypothetical protein
MSAPDNLLPFLDGTPLAIYRLELAWSGLSQTEKASSIFYLLEDPKHKVKWFSQTKRIEDLALTDDSEYIRYLIGRRFNPPHYAEGRVISERDQREATIFNKLQTENTPLIRTGHQESGWKVAMKELDHPNEFWQREHVERLAIVNGVKHDGERLARLLEAGIAKMQATGKPSEDELLEVLLQYLGGDSIEERVRKTEEYARSHYDGWAEFSTGESVKALWLLIPKAPVNLAHALIRCLPENAGFQTGIPDEVLKNLGPYLLSELLFRKAIKLKELRREIFEQQSTQEDDPFLLKTAAISSPWFRLKNEDISRHLYDIEEPEETGSTKYQSLVFIAENIIDANLAQLAALHALIDGAPSNFIGWGNYHVLPLLKDKQVKRAKEIDPNTLAHEIIQMRTFALALELAPLKEEASPATPEHKIFESAICERNPWQTFLNLIALKIEGKWNAKDTRLPEVYLDGVQLETDAENAQNERECDLVFELKNLGLSLSEDDVTKFKMLGEKLNDMSERLAKSYRAALLQLDNSKRDIETQLKKIQGMIISSAFVVIVLIWAIVK